MWTEVINSHFSHINIWRNEEMCVPLQNALELINYETRSDCNLSDRGRTDTDRCPFGE